MKMRTPSNHDFARVPGMEIQRSVFNRTHGHKTTFNAGYLIPIYIDEALPGDSFNLNGTFFARLATPKYPIMDNLKMDIHFFAVPNRLVWSNWQKFMGEQLNPDSSTDFVVPQILCPAVGGWAELSLADYFGLPTKIEDLSVCAFWHRAYNLIFDTWYRDQNLQNSEPLLIDNGPDADTSYQLLKRNKRHDYFTSALPWPQKGPAVDLPLGDYAPVQGIGKLNTSWDASPVTVYETGKTGSSSFTPERRIGDGVSDEMFFVQNDPDNPTHPGIFANLQDATASTINALRQAFQLQRMFEKDARGGTRYIEIIKTHFGVVSPDARLQRPEYLGGTSADVNITPVPSTYTSEDARPQGSLAGYGTVAAHGGFTKSFVEHCVIIGLLSVRADQTYQQGIPRMFSRSTKFDFYWPGLAHLGEQGILNKEIFATGVTTGPDNDDDIFGYQERYAEYRYYPSKVTGLFRSNAAQSLDAWHLAQEFEDLPFLDELFIVENPPMDRVIAVPSEPDFILDSYMKCITARPMPVYSVPGLIDHF